MAQKRSSMDITFQQVSKRFSYEWIFRNIDYTFSSGQKIGIIGPNGSGKSTFLRVLLGTVEPSSGKVMYFDQGTSIPVEQVYNKFSFAAPYMDLPGNFTMEEIIRFHFSFRKPQDNISAQQLIELAQLGASKRKYFNQFSSGMKQRFKLALAFCSESYVVVLDEPTTNLDSATKKWFEKLVEDRLKQRSLIIATNEPFDLQLCDTQFDIMNYKKKKG